MGRVESGEVEAVKDRGWRWQEWASSYKIPTLAGVS